MSTDASAAETGDTTTPTGALLVATPSADDPVNALSEEEQAHITLLWFGDAAFLAPQLVDAIRRHAFDVAGHIAAFEAQICGRAVLGPDEAGVLLIESAELVELRTALFESLDVQDAYLQAQQYPWWVPHLTVQYSKGLPGGTLPDTITFDGVGLWLAGQHESFALQPLGAVEPDEEEALLSAGLTIPPVLTAADLPVCVAHAKQHPDARWYAKKRAHALGLESMLPAEWSGA